MLRDVLFGVGSLLAPRRRIDSCPDDHHAFGVTPPRPDWWPNPLVAANPGLALRLTEAGFRLFCRKEIGHCYHLDAKCSPMEPEWWCCLCPSETAGFPPNRCRYCASS